MGVDTKLKHLPLSEIVSTDGLPMATELIFTNEVSFLTDDLVMTLELVESEARRLLTSLTQFRKDHTDV